MHICMVHNYKYVNGEWNIGLYKREADKIEMAKPHLVPSQGHKPYSVVDRGEDGVYINKGLPLSNQIKTVWMVKCVLQCK